MHILETPIDYLKGVGPARADLLKKELKIFTYSDLLHHYPFRYIDKTKIYKIADLVSDMPSVQLKGKIIKFEDRGQRKNKRLIGHFQDETGVIELVWFKGIRWIKSGVKLDSRYIVFGKPSVFQGTFNIVHPELDLQLQGQKSSVNLQAVYHSTELLNANLQCFDV